MDLDLGVCLMRVKVRVRMKENKETRNEKGKIEKDEGDDWRKGRRE